MQAIATPFGTVFADVKKLNEGDLVVLYCDGEVDQDHAWGLADALSKQIDATVLVFEYGVKLETLSKDDAVDILRRIVEN